MFSDVEVDNAAAMVREHDEDEEDAERSSGDGEEIDANHVAGVIGEESLPSLGGRLRRFDPVFGDG